VSCAPALGLGVIGAGAFARFVLSAADDLPTVEVVAVTDADHDRAQRVAAAHRARPVAGLAGLLDEDRVEAVVIATPPSTHAPLAVQALAAGRHVFCEKPVALTDSDADRVRGAVLRSGRTFVVDHVLRYNPVLAALRRLHDDRLLGAVQRLAFENDAADEDLPAGHWFWDDTVSGGILLEHGVHFFDAAAMLISEPAYQVQAIGGARPGGPIDTVVCTVAHVGGALASYAHGFSHPRRAERQLMRVDFGLAEARVHGWIPLRVDLDAWADDAAADRFEQLPGHATELLAIAGIPRSGREQITVSVTRDAAPAPTRARGRPRRAPHHVRARIQLGSADAKHRVYRDSVRAALLDLTVCARTGSTPRADIEAGRAAVHIAVAGTRALRDGCTHRLSNEELPCPAD